jgi:hypothetical protein
MKHIEIDGKHLFYCPFCDKWVDAMKLHKCEEPKKTYKGSL